MQKMHTFGIIAEKCQNCFIFIFLFNVFFFWGGGGGGVDV